MVMIEPNVRDASITIGTTPVKVSAMLKNMQRQALVIVNTSPAGQIVSLNWGKGTAVIGTGITLYPAGTHSEEADRTPIPSVDIYAVSNAADATISIQERTIAKV